MPALNGLAASCKFVDDAALTTLPDFPSLTELVPMDVGDDGFRHIARCQQLGIADSDVLPRHPLDGCIRVL